MHSLYHKLSEIPDYIYTGYIWLSDQSRPEILDISKFDFTKIGKNPFIVEAYLYAEKKNISIAIKKYDDKYYISQVDLNKIDTINGQIKKHTYIADESLGPKIKKLSFKEYWQPKTDELCENMKVLKPTWIAFTGFEKGGQK
jgi:CRISPR type III-associated protein (TIGR04423 family)